MEDNQSIINTEQQVSNSTHNVVDTNNGTSEQVQEKKKKSRKGLLVIIILILLCSIGGTSYLLYNKVTPEKAKSDKKFYVSEYKIHGNDLSDFDLSFLKLENEEKNKVYSPLSIKYALEMLAEGAKGESKDQIDAVIGEYKAKSYPNSEHMSFANAMFIRDSYKDNVKETYTNKLKSKYGAEVVFDPFTSPDNLNSWVSNKTFNLVNNLVDDVSANDFYLINALAIDMNWNNQIHCSIGGVIPCYKKGTYSVYYSHEKISDEAQDAYSNVSYPYESSFPKMTFNEDVGGVQYSEVLADFNRYDIVKELGEDKIRSEVTAAYKEWLGGLTEVYDWYDSNGVKHDGNDVDGYVNNYIVALDSNYNKADNNTDFYLYTDDHVKVFAKDLQEYDGLTLQYVGIMPKQKDLNKYINDINSNDINTIISNLKDMKIENFKDGVATIVTGKIPFFKYEYELNLENDLQKMGIKDVLDKDRADLTNMVENKDAYINKTIHKANIEFSNEGIKAAAATAAGGFGAASGGFEYLYKIPTEIIDLDFDKPYMYIIRDKSTGEVWFAGTVYEPGN